MARYDQQLHDLIVTMWMSGMKNSVIAETINVCDTTVDNHIMLARKNGEIPKDFKKKRVEGNTAMHNVVSAKRERKPRKPREQKPFQLNPLPGTKKQIPEKPDGIIVNCTKSVSKKCVYGIASQTTDSALCNYILCEGHMRGCDPKECNKFSKITKDNPRRNSII